MNKENILEMLVNLGSLMKQNSERLNVIAHLNPSQEQLSAFRDYHKKALKDLQNPFNNSKRQRQRLPK